VHVFESSDTGLNRFLDEFCRDGECADYSDSAPAGRQAEYAGDLAVQVRASYNVEDHGARYLMPAGRGVVEGGTIPYTPEALEQRKKNYAERYTADPLTKCWMPGIPRIMYMEYPFQIFQMQDHVAMLFEWSYIYRIVYMHGKPTPHPGLEHFMGDSRGRWEGDTLVVDIDSFTDRTWLDMSGNFHSNEMKLTERYTMTDPDTIRYQVTVTDPKVFTRPWTMSMNFYRQKEADRLLEYYCQAELEEHTGDFERDPRTWYPNQ
jgi:hypothetical protein